MQVPTEEPPSQIYTMAQHLVKVGVKGQQLWGWANYRKIPKSQASYFLLQTMGTGNLVNCSTKQKEQTKRLCHAYKTCQDKIVNVPSTFIS